MGVAFVFVIILIIQFIQDPFTEYKKVMLENRKQKVAFFKNGADSPIPDSLKSSFEGLFFYPPDLAFKAEADFVVAKGDKQVLLAENSGEGKTYQKAGILTFKLSGQDCKLTAFYERENNGANLFIPFSDLTAGKETYGGGRYLEAKLVGDKALLDFNRAYHPYCVFNYSYVCPMPPEENKLNLKVRAGERLK